MSRARPQNPRGTSNRQRSNTAEVGKFLTEGVRAQQAGQLRRAAEAYRHVLALQPTHADALHLLGLIAYQTGDNQRAETLIGQALHSGDCAAFHNSLGVVYLACRRFDQAIASFRAALSRDPLLAEAFNNLGNALQQTEKLEEAVSAYDHAIAVRPDYAEAFANRGRSHQLLNHLTEAIADFRNAIHLRPNWPKAYRYLGDALAEAGDRAGAEDSYRRAMSLSSQKDAEASAGFAALLERESHLDEALAQAQSALALDGQNIRARLTAARCQRRLGRPADAIRDLEAVAFADLDREARLHLVQEKALSFDRLKKYREAYDYFAEANQITLAGPQARNVDRSSFPRLIETLSSRFTPEWLATWSPTVPEASPSPAFLIGFPRSGTTLLDQILDSHPQAATMEEKNAVDVVRSAITDLPGGYPDALVTLGERQQGKLRELYFTEVSRHLGSVPAGLLIDKMPLNIVDVGLIYRLFPQARFILALRHPCDVVLSGFMQAFQPNAAMIHLSAINDAARFYAQTMTLWQQYHTVLPLSVHTIRYEDLVADLAGEARRMLEFLCLPWDDAVLGYAEHARGRAIKTPSYHQVVQPIYRGSIGRWQNYDFVFTEALPILAPFIAAFGYDEKSDAA